MTIGEYMDALQSPIPQAEAAPVPQAAQGAPPAAAQPQVDFSSLQDQLGQQAAAQHQQQQAIIELLQRQQAQPQPQASQGPSPEELAIRQQDMQLRQIEAANQIAAQQQAADRQAQVMEQQLDIMRQKQQQVMTNPKTSARRKMKVIRDEFGALAGAEIEG